jgi:type II secretory ATPase GspE/PulE/Tfp pilus assembly ATPase PilB-like protein
MKKEILKILQNQGLLSEERVFLINQKLTAGDDFEEIMKSFQVPGDKVADAKSKAFDLPRYVGNDPDDEVVKSISGESAKHYRMIFLGEDADSISLGVLDPETVNLKEAAVFLAKSKGNKNYKFFILTITQFEDYIGLYFGKKIRRVEESEVSDTLQKDGTNAGIKFNTNGGTDIKVDDSPVVRLVRDVVGEAIKKGASDIHIEGSASNVYFRYRVDGDLVIVRELPMSQHQAVVARIKILANLKLDERRKPQDGHFSIDYEGRKIDFRVSTMPAYFGEKVVLRILDTYKGVRNLDELQMYPPHLSLVREALNYPFGIVLVTGPTGSGKTSTLYSMLNSLDKEGRNIVSLEDPIEYSVAGVNQSQVAPEIGYTFANGLRSILRQDPDVIMVGEIRDAETAELAVQAALTGHLVFSTIHTNTSISTITRLVEMGIPHYLIAPTVKLIIAQRLVHKLVDEKDAPHEIIPIEGSYKEMVKKEFGDMKPEFLATLPFTDSFHAQKPSDKSRTGMEGRIAVFEMLEIDKDVEKLILSKADENKIYELARQKGMITLKEDALLKSMNGRLPFRESMGL